MKKYDLEWATELVENGRVWYFKVLPKRDTWLLEANKQWIKQLYDSGRRPLCYGWEFGGSGKYIYCTFKFPKHDIYYEYYAFKFIFPNIVTHYTDFEIVSFIIDEI